MLAFSALIPYDDSIDMAMSDAADGFVSKGQGNSSMESRESILRTFRNLIPQKHFMI